MIQRSAAGNLRIAHRPEVSTAALAKLHRQLNGPASNFIGSASDLVHANGLKDAEIHLQRKTLTLPGYFRPTKIWDMLVLHRGHLVSAMEFKSQVGPSFGNNFLGMNRCQ